MVTIALAPEWSLYAVAALVGVGAWFVYLWAVQDGQFKRVEEPAERLLDQDARSTVVPDDAEEESR